MSAMAGGHRRVRARAAPGRAHRGLPDHVRHVADADEPGRLRSGARLVARAVHQRSCAVGVVAARPVRPALRRNAGPYNGSVARAWCSAATASLVSSTGTSAASGALVGPEVMPFWRAVLGYEYRSDTPDEDLIDPRGAGRCGGPWPTPKATRWISLPRWAATERDECSKVDRRLRHTNTLALATGPDLRLPIARERGERSDVPDWRRHWLSERRRRVCAPPPSLRVCPAHDGAGN